jgi:hypothetical protein
MHFLLEQEFLLKKFGILLLSHGTHPSSHLSVPATLTQESNVGNDGLMLQSTFDVNIKEEVYLVSLCPDPHLLVASMPSNDQLKKHYKKLLKGVILLRKYYPGATLFQQ